MHCLDMYSLSIRQLANSSFICTSPVMFEDQKKKVSTVGEVKIDWTLLQRFLQRCICCAQVLKSVCKPVSDTYTEDRQTKRRRSRPEKTVTENEGEVCLLCSLLFILHSY